MKHRYENFGGIIAGEDPPFLAFVDRDYMRDLGFADSPLWDTEDLEVGLLSAPTEVHLAVTNACDAGCPHCYMDSGERPSDELSTEALKEALDALARLGVFHVAMGGGEALLREDLFEAAAHARAVGLVPNLTVSGLHLTREIARKMRVFGQVNVSLDGVGEASAVFRGKNLFAVADRALGLLLDAGVPTGINTVLGRNNFDALPELFSYAAQKGVNEVEILRVKPSGRGREAYLGQKTTPEQNERLVPYLSELSEKHGVTAKIDCSFVPMLVWHNPPMEALLAMATYGCEAGNVLLGVRSNGRVAGCSFLPETGLTLPDLATPVHQAPALVEHTRWHEIPPAPCASCDYLMLCKGGCRAVALAVTGSVNAPDPDCPRVRRLEKTQGE